MSRIRANCHRIPLLLVASTFLVAAVSVSTASAVSRAVTASTDLQTTSADGGGMFTVSARVPVAAPGTVSQSITMSFDSSRARVTGANGIVAPSGWTLTYSSDGTNFGAAPASASGWATIRAVRATGSILSGGDAAGLQVATGSGTATVPPSGAFNAGGGGDGWDVAFDEQGHVYNTFHHDGYWGSGFITPGLHCHTRSGASCGPGWPFALRVPHGTTGPDGISGQPWYHTNDQAMQWVDVVNNRVWIPTNLNDGTSASGTGFVCVDVSDLATGPAWCGGGIRNAFVKLGATLCGRDCAVGLAAADEKLFAWDTGSGRLLCLDPYSDRSGGLPGAPCPNQPFGFSGITRTVLGEYALLAAEGLVWGSSDGKAVCFDPVSLSACTAWSSGPSTLSGTPPNLAYNVPTSTATAGAVCFARYDASRGCFAADGNSSSELSGSHVGSAFIAYLVGRNTTQILPKNGETSGTRIIWADGAWPGGGKVYCYDTSLSGGTGGACPNFPVNHSAYTATIDTQNANCIWTNTDNGTIATIDAMTGGSTCTTPPSVAEFSAPVIVPRLSCTSASSIQQWRSFKLTSPAASTYSTATLTVLTSSGAVVNGWNRVAIPANGRMVDLSSLPVASSGLSPRFKVSLADKSTTDLIGGEVTVVGGSPELCVPLQTVAWCPTGPVRIAAAMASPSPVQISISGEAQPSSGPVETFTAATTSVNVSPPSDSSCLGTIGGAATMVSSSAAVPNAQVRLLSASGAVLATTTTDSSGNYVFTRLVSGGGYRVEFGPTPQGAATSATESSVTTDRSVTVGATTMVNGTYALLRTDLLSGQGEHGRSVTVTPSPHDSNGVQGYSAFTKSATCVVDPIDSQCKSTVVVPGEGTWNVDANSGSLTFAPTVGFSGTTSRLAYKVTESSSSLVTWNLASVNISAPVVTTSTVVRSVGASSTTRTSSIVTQPAGSAARAASTGVLVSRVRVNSPSRIVQSGTAIVGGARVVAVNCASMNINRAATVDVRCWLTTAVRRAVQRASIELSMTTRVVTRSGRTTSTRTIVKLPRNATLPVTR